jgi:hypothetical protein
MGFLVNNWILFSSIIMFYLVYFTNYFHVFNKFWRGWAQFNASIYGISKFHGSLIIIFACNDKFRGKEC